METRHSLGLDDLISHRVPHELTDGMKLKLTHDVSAMRFRGFYADAKSHCDFLAALPFREELNDLALPGSEPATQDSHVVGHRVLFAEPVQQHVRSARCEERTMVAKGLDRRDEVPVSIGFHDVGANTSFNNVADELIGEVQSKNDDFRFGKALADAPGSLQAV